MELKVNVESGVKTLEIRQGQALPLKEQEKVLIEGLITAPGDYWDKRSSLHKSENCHVLVDRREGVLKLICDEKDAYGTEIIGGLSINPVFKDFRINDQKTPWTPSEFASFIKMNTIFFRDKEDALKLTSVLRNLKYNVNKEVERTDDRRGNRTDLMRVVLTNANIPSSFVLKLPIFEGEEENTFGVELEIDVRDTELYCYLISAEAQQIVQETKDKILDRELARLSSVVCLNV